ncbi:MAG: adenosine deaminase [Acidimicrobiia bacterium]
MSRLRALESFAKVTDLEQFCRGLPKAELHVHIEGTLEPELTFELARRNDIALGYSSVDEVRAAYEFTNLQSFLDIYYQGAQVVQTERDFYDLMLAYLERAAADGVRRAEIFFDPQIHTERGFGFDVFMPGFHQAQTDAEEEFGISSDLILCFLRHLSGDQAVATLREAMPFRDWFIGVGLDSSEIGNPPEKFEEAFRLALQEGLRAVAHAGEEGPPSYVAGALDTLGAERIDHGVRAAEDEVLLQRLVADEIPLTMCPISNVRLRAFDRLEDHILADLLRQAAKVSINSDDPSYFGGYVGDNYVKTAEALGLSREELATVARNSFEAAFVSDEARAGYLAEVDEHVS